MFNKRHTIDNINIIKGTLEEFSKYYNDSKYMKSEFEKMVNDENLIPFFALSGNKMIGKIYFVNRINDPQIADGKQCGYICNLYVKKSFRNNGIGTKLVNTVKSYAKASKYDSIILGVEESNSKNMYLYSKLGFNERLNTVNSDLIFRKPNGESIYTNEYTIYSCTL